MPVRMEIEDLSDEESGRGTSKQQDPSKKDPLGETAQEQAIDDNQAINEEYKIWSVFPLGRAIQQI